MNRGKTIEIYGHRPDLSMRVEAGKDYFEKEFKLKCYAISPFHKAMLRIHVNEYNFLYLQEMVAYCLKFLPENNHIMRSCDNLGFLNCIQDNLYKGFQAYIDRLNTQLYQQQIRILATDEGLKNLFKSVENRIEKGMWKDFFQKLLHVKNQSTNLNDELRVLGILLDRTFIGPVDLVLDLIHVCNTNCAHCWIHSPNASKGLNAAFKKQAMSLETVKAIVDDACRLGVNGITLLGDGEPLLHPNFLDILKYIRNKNLFIETIAFTNGYCLSASLSRQLINEGLSQLTCSLPAATPETYAQICSKTGKPGFDQIINNLKTLNRIKKRKKTHKLLKRKIPELTVAFVLHRLNYHEICGMARIAGEVGADKVRFQLIHLDKDNRHLKLNADHLLFLKNHIHQAQQIVDDYGMKFQSSLSFQLDHMNISRGDWSENVYFEKGCFIGWTFSILKADGDLGFCCALKKIGNISALGYQANWDSDRYNSYRIGAKHLKTNSNMCFERTPYQKEKNGFRLFSDRCQHCDNHDQNNYMLRLLEDSGLIDYIKI
jgi:MoaA/NifB/PqqE/SkfB family radical SAM enzyme